MGVIKDQWSSSLNINANAHVDGLMFTALAFMPTDRNRDSEELSKFSSYFEKTYIGYFHHINKPMQFRPHLPHFYIW